MPAFSLVLLTVLAASAAAAPAERWHPNAVGANYFATNGFEGNQLIASYILPDGTLVAGTASSTNGNGSAGISDPMPYENHPDPFYGSGSVVVTAKNKVVVVNAGSNTFSVFDIDPQDPAKPCFKAAYPTLDFPISLAASPDGSVVCALTSGRKNGFSCYNATADPWQPMERWTREFGFNLTTPPHGPVGRTPSQIIFSGDAKSIMVTIKGMLSTDLNNPSGQVVPGQLSVYTIGNDGSLSSIPAVFPSAMPFSIAEDHYNPGFYFGSEVSKGYETWNIKDNKTVVGAIPHEAASCWAAQSWISKNYYTIDIVGLSNITEISVNSSTLEGRVVKQHSLGFNASGTDVSIFRGAQLDWMYVNAPGYHAVHLYEISGPGHFALKQRYGFNEMPMGTIKTGGFSGQAVYYKKGYWR